MLVLLAQLVQVQMLNYDTLCSLLCAALCLVSRSKKIGAGPKKEYADIKHTVKLTVCGSKPFAWSAAAKRLEPSGGKSDKLIGRTRISRRRARDIRSKKGLLNRGMQRDV